MRSMDMNHNALVLIDSVSSVSSDVDTLPHLGPTVSVSHQLCMPSDVKDEDTSSNVSTNILSSCICIKTTILHLH